jgi:hypothetical protein
LLGKINFFFFHLREQINWLESAWTHAGNADSSLKTIGSLTGNSLLMAVAIEDEPTIRIRTTCFHFISAHKLIRTNLLPTQNFRRLLATKNATYSIVNFAADQASQPELATSSMSSFIVQNPNHIRS